MRKPVKREIGDHEPIFGNDLQEVEALRVLEKYVWWYAQEECSFGELIGAANAVRAIRRNKRKN